MTLLPPRSGNEVAYVTQIIDDLRPGVAGAVFGEVAGCLCLLRALEMRLHM